MFVINNQPNMKHIGLPPSGKPLTLHPGVNSVEPNAWEKIVTVDVIVQAWIKEGALTVIEDDIKKGISAPLTVELVAKTFRQDQLMAWLSKHPTGPLAFAIQQQLEKIDPTKPVREE
jgi:hypothetical protein